MSDLNKTQLSLEGIATGDAFGEMFFSHPASLIERRELPPAPWLWTDDTAMALSIVEILKEYGHIDQDALAGAFARRYRQEPWRGYGSGAHRLLAEIANGGDWRKLTPSLFPGGSYGNGGAMRAAPIGAFYASEPDQISGLGQAAEQARRAAQVTHAHPEGQAGAIAVAVAAAIAAGPNPVSGAAFLEGVLAYTPQGQTAQGIHKAIQIPPGELERAITELGVGWKISAQDTVPFCLWCAAYHLDDYQDGLWQTVAGLGDRDTTCAIVGGILALSCGRIPAEWEARREPLPMI